MQSHHTVWGKGHGFDYVFLVFVKNVIKTIKISMG